VLTMRAKYALKALAHLARRPGEHVLIADLSREELLPKKFLEVILLDLKQLGMLESRPGRGGGYRLALPASSISLLAIVRAADGPVALLPCVSETAYRRCDDCKSEEACALRRVMKEVHAATSGILARTTLADLARAPHALEGALAS
jgi:Rrf2 family protein